MTRSFVCWDSPSQLPCVYMHNASSIISWQSYQFILNWLGCISTWLCNYKHSLEFVIYMYFISTTLQYKMPFFSLIFLSWKHKTYWVNTNLCLISEILIKIWKIMLSYNRCRFPQTFFFAVQTLPILVLLCPF